MSYYFDYIVQTFHTVYGNDFDLKISYGNSVSDILIKNYSNNFFDSVDPIPKNIVWKEWKGTKIPFLFSTDNSLPIINYKNNTAVINYDIIGSAFYFLSGWQEIHSKKRDEFGRYPFNETLQYKHELLVIPLVNYYFDILKSVIEKLSGKNVKRILWPDSNIAVSISHDIDKINSGWLEGGFSELKNGHFLSALKIILLKIFRKDPWDNLKEIISLEKQLEINSTFFFLTEKSPENADYSISQVEKYFSEIRSAKSEIALHGSIGSSSSSEKIISEKNKLPFKIKGNRFHFLMLEPTEYASNIDKSGLLYDSSLGFAEHIGFRNGFCFPFFPFNHLEKKAHAFIEIPLMLMDTTLKKDSYMGTDNSRDLKIESLISEVEKFNGLISILWHNNYFSNFKYEGWRDKFINLINRTKNSNPCYLTKSEICKQMGK